VARVLIVGGGCRGRRLAADLIAEGHALRITARSESSRAAIEGLGAQCWVGTPQRLASLRGALENVSIVCWLLATARGAEQELAALYGPRLEAFLRQAIDSTVRGFVYEAAAGAAPCPGVSGPEASAHGDGAQGGGVSSRLLAHGELIVQEASARNAIPIELVRADPGAPERWLAACRGAISALLGSPVGEPVGEGRAGARDSRPTTA
jgi:hypothetical protein